MLQLITSHLQYSKQKVRHLFERKKTANIHKDSVIFFFNHRMIDWLAVALNYNMNCICLYSVSPQFPFCRCEFYCAKSEMTYGNNWFFSTYIVATICERAAQCEYVLKLNKTSFARNGSTWRKAFVYSFIHNKVVHMLSVFVQPPSLFFAERTERQIKTLNSFHPIPTCAILYRNCLIWLVLQHAEKWPLRFLL